MRMRRAAALLLLLSCSKTTPTLPTCEGSVLFGAPNAKTGLDSSACGPGVCTCGGEPFTPKTWALADLNALRAFQLTQPYAEVLADPYADAGTWPAVPSDAVVREVHEETGLDAVVGETARVYSAHLPGVWRDGRRVDAHALRIVYDGWVPVDAPEPRVLEVGGSEGSLAWDSERPDRLRIGGRKGPNQVLDRDPALLSPEAAALSDYPGGHTEGFPDTFKQLFRAVYGWIADGGKGPARFPTFDDGDREVRLCEAIARSAREQRWVSVEAAGGG